MPKRRFAALMWKKHDYPRLSPMVGKAGVLWKKLVEKRGRLSSRPERQHLAGRRRLGAELGPGIHQPPALIEQRATSIGSFHSIGNGMRQRLLANLLRVGGIVGGPIGKRRAEAVRRAVSHPHRPQGFLESIAPDLLA